MEMWKILTQKFKAQSLDEVQPFRRQEVEDQDSGTESDEENAELQAIEEAMQSRRDQENYKPQVQSSLADFAMTPSPPLPSLPPPAVGYHQSPMQSSASPIGSAPKRPFQLVSQSGIRLQALSSSSSSHKAGRGGQFYDARLRRASPTESSDYERCSLDYEPSSSTEFDDERHSSEDELTIINCRGRHELHPEKRKWSQANRCHSCDDSSGSSDDELRDLFCESKPLNFSSSPPKGVQKLSRALSSPPPVPTAPATARPLFLADLSPKSVRLCSVSPRKRHRQTNSSDVSDATVIQRPCLDFEKMQKTLFRKHLPHGVTKARIVKIRVGLLKGAL